MTDQRHGVGSVDGRPVLPAAKNALAGLCCHLLHWQNCEGIVEQPWHSNRISIEFTAQDQVDANLQGYCLHPAGGPVASRGVLLSRCRFRGWALDAPPTECLQSGGPAGSGWSNSCIGTENVQRAERLAYYFYPPSGAAVSMSILKYRTFRTAGL